MSVPDIFSVECEVCGAYNISPIKCESCWRKEQKKKMIEKFEKLIDEFFQYCGIHEDWKRAMLKKLKQMEKEE